MLIKIWFSDIRWYHTYDNITDLYWFDHKNIGINSKIIIFDNKKVNTLEIIHNVSLDKHILNFEKSILSKNKPKINLEIFLKLVNDFSFTNYISSYKILDRKIDIFLLNPVNKYLLSQKPIIAKWMDKNQNISFVKWLSESIERYSLNQLKSDKLLNTNNKCIVKNFSERFLWYLLDRYKYSNENNWIPIFKLKSFSKNKLEIDINKKIVVPSDFVFLYNKKKSINSYISNSNWVSTHISYYDAFLNSYYELLERDAIALTYYYKLQPYLIKVNNNYYEKILLDIKKKYGYNLYFFDLNFDYWINIVLSVWINKKKKLPFMFFWAWSDINFKKAFDKSLNEVLYLIDTSERINYEAYIKSNFYKIKNLDIYDTKEHILYYIIPEHYKEINYLFKNKKFKYFSDIQDFTENKLIDKINNENFYIANLTTEFWKKYWFFTIKIFSYKYIPFWFWKWFFPENKITNRFSNIKNYLIENSIFERGIFNKYFDKNKSFLHFMW